MNLRLAGFLCPSDGARKMPAALFGGTNDVGNDGGPGPLAPTDANADFSGTIIPDDWYSAPNLGPNGFESVRDGHGASPRASLRSRPRETWLE